MKIFKRIVLGAVIFIVAVVAILMVSIPLSGIGGAERVAAVTNTTIPGINGGPEVRAYIARPQGDGPFPTVIMIHEFYGINESIIGKAEGLAEAGYLVVAPDTFRGSTTAWIPRAIYQVITNTPEHVNDDLDSVFVWLTEQPDVDASRIGIAGFCYGGRTSLLYSLHNIKIATTVVFYGSAETNPEVLKALPGPVLGIFGSADQSIPLEEVEAFEAGLQTAGIPHEITVYDGQPHAFVTDIDAIRAGGVQGQAWDQMLRFLETNLKIHGSSQRGQSIAYESVFPFRYYAMLVYEHTLGSASHGH